MPDPQKDHPQVAQLEAGYTVQSSKYEEAITHFDEIPEGKREFMRSPNQYGYAILTHLAGSLPERLNI